MKKAVLILGIIVICAYSTVAMAESVDAIVPLQLTIPSQFGFTLDKYAHDFGTVNTGSGAEVTIGIFCRSNHGLVWHMGVQADPFTSTTNDIMPSDPGFKMAAWSWAEDPDDSAQGTFKYEGPIPSTIMYDFYDSTEAEGGDPFVPMTLGLYVNVPSAQASGLYTTDLIITMHE